MTTKTILGLDLGTNSIGWALIKQDFENKQGEILGMGSRIIPMDGAIMGDFDKGNSVSQTAERTRLRSMRRLKERHLLRRERLHRVLNVLDFLPEHYAKEIDFDKRLGQFKEESEPKVAWRPTGIVRNGKNTFEFLFPELFEEMLADFKKHQPALLDRKNRNGESVKVPIDWTIYYLRTIALKRAVSKEQLAWLLLNFNQKRGYYQLRGEDEDFSTNKSEYVSLLKIVEIKDGELDKRNDKKRWYTMCFENGWEYSATFTTKPDWVNTEREFLITEELNEDGSIKVIKDRKQDKEGKEKRTITPLPTLKRLI